MTDDRFEAIYDANEYIIDHRTGEYLTMEDVAYKLNIYHEFIETFMKGINKE